MNFPGLTPTEKSVLNCLAFFAMNDDLEAWPSAATIAKVTSFGISAVKTARASLVLKGALTSAFQSKGGNSNRYRVNLDKPVGTRPVDIESSRARSVASRPVQPVATRPVPIANRSPDDAQPVTCQPSTGQQVTANKERTKKRTRTKSDQPEKRFTADDRTVAEEIFAKIQILNPGHKLPNLEAWADQVRVMRERDGRSLDEIRELFAWANAEQFWKTNILSPATLRKQWDRLTIRRNTSANGSRRGDFVLESPI